MSGGKLGGRRLAHDAHPPVLSLSQSIIALVLALICSVSWVYYLSWARAGTRLHDAPVTVVAPNLVVTPLADQLDSLPRHPFAVHGTSDLGEALADLRAGRTDAVLDVDLARTRDRLLLSSRDDPALNHALVAQARLLERARGRSLAMQLVSPGSTSSPTAPTTLRLFTVAALLLGYLVALALSLVGGPVSGSALRGGVRVLIVLGTSALFGGLLSKTGGSSPWMASAGFATMTAASSATLALEALAGWWGLALMVPVFFSVGLPLLTAVPAAMSPQPWRSLGSFTVPGAGWDAQLRAGSYGAPNWRALAVLAVWSTMAWLVCVAGNWTRPRAGVVLPGESEALAGSQGRRTAASPPAELRAWRRRLLGVVVPIGLLALCFAALVPQSATARPPSTANRTTTSACAGTGTVTSLRDLNRIADMHGTPRFQGGDVGIDARLQDGRRVLLFGDTLTSEGYVRNSMLIVGHGCLRSVLEPGLQPVITGRAPGPGQLDRVGYWPMSVVVRHEHGFDLLYVMVQRVTSGGANPWDFTTLGGSVAVFVVPRGGTPQPVLTRDFGPDDPSRSRPTWGAATWLTRRWLYIYGTANPGTRRAWGYSLRVARVALPDLLDLSRWRYWDGSSWVRSASRAMVLIPAKNGVSQTLSVVPQGGRWYAISERNDFLGTGVTSWVAPSPTGPFDAGHELAPLAGGPRSVIKYMPLAHPGILPLRGTMVISYSTNDQHPRTVRNHPRRYRIHFLRVRLP